MSTKILELLRDYNATILCRTLPRLAGSRSQKNNTSLNDSYKFLLQEKIVSLNSNDGMQNHIYEFSSFCGGNNLHMLYTDLLKNIIFAFCAPDVVKQLGERRRQQVVRGIFMKSFQETSNLLIKIPAIFDMAVNRSDNCFEPCQQLAANAIETIKMNVFNEEINGIAMSTTNNTVTVPAKLYETLKKKYDINMALQIKHGHDMTQALNKIKAMAEALKKSQVEIQALRTRLRDRESIPKELSFVGEESHIREPQVSGDIDTDDSVSQSGYRPVEVTANNNKESQLVPAAQSVVSSAASTTSASSKSSKNKTSRSQSIVEDDRDDYIEEPKPEIKPKKPRKSNKKQMAIDEEEAIDVDSFNSFFDD